MRASFLDEIAGIGPKRKKALLHHFKSVQAIRQAGVEDLLKVESIDRKTAQKIKDRFLTQSEKCPKLNRRTVP